MPINFIINILFAYANKLNKSIFYFSFRNIDITIKIFDYNPL